MKTNEIELNWIELNWINDVVCLFSGRVTSQMFTSFLRQRGMLHKINLFWFQLRLGFFKSSLIWDLELLVKPYD